MTERITQKRLYRLQDHVNKGLGRPLTAYTKDIHNRYTTNDGHLKLDFAACYGGWDLVELRGGGETSWSGRLSAREMWAYLSGMVQAIERAPKVEIVERVTQYILDRADEGGQ